MLARLSAADLPALAALRTRENDDFSVALFDAWATVADVLTFYQERLANESYLRTATERRSLLELARLIGYELRPGVAASTYLAFALEEAPGAPAQTTVEVGVKVQSVPGPGENAQTFETIEKIEARVEWNALQPQLSQLVVPAFGSTYVYLKGTATNLKPGDALLLVGMEREGDPGSERWDFRRVTAVTPDHKAERTRVEWEGGLGSVVPRVLPAAQPQVYALRQRASLFGHNAPHPAVLSDQTLRHYNQAADADWTFTITGQTIDLDATYPGILPHSWLVLSRPNYQELYRVDSVSEASRTAFTLTAKTTRLILDTDENLNGFDGANLRATVVFAQSELLEMTKEPLTTPVAGDNVTLTRQVDGLTEGRLLLVSGKESATGEPVSEVVAVLKAETSGNRTKLFFKSLSPHTPALVHSYKRETVAINANVARATHGETVQEILGSGDAGQSYQRFTLRQPPLTYVSASTPSGAESTLQVRVNDLLWRETPALYGREAHDHVFVTRTEDDGKTTIQWGDGITGARLPSGQDNVRVTYRKGIGLEGLVKAEQLSLLLTRPLGVKAVTNPLPATGAADRESLKDARGNAPLTVLTLDRTVSLQDYEDFARAYAGISKALATWTWEKQTRRVFVTVAGPNGAEVASGSELYKNLLTAMQKAGDPYVDFRVKSYRRALFKITGGVIVDPLYQPEKVMAAVEQALRGQFSFDARDFGQLVSLSEVIAAIQAVPGVAAVDVDALYRTGQAAVPSRRLVAELPKIGADGEMVAAELLTLDPAPLNGLVVKS
jgi:hypothetical protein